MTTGVQLGLFASAEEEYQPVVGGLHVRVGRSVVVQNCWNPIDWHVVSLRDGGRTRRTFWTACEAVFYATAPGLFRHLGRAKAKNEEG